MCEPPHRSAVKVPECVMRYDSIDTILDANPDFNMAKKIFENNRKQLIQYLQEVEEEKHHAKPSTRRNMVCTQ